MLQEQPAEQFAFADAGGLAVELDDHVVLLEAGLLRGGVVAVFAGMLGVTVFGIFLTPVFYYVMEKLGGTGKSVGTAVVPEVPPRH